MNNAQSCPVGGVAKVLLATDGSVYSEGAVSEAINFAKQAFCNIGTCGKS
jgi:hypothetical protein